MRKMKRMWISICMLVMALTMLVQTETIKADIPAVVLESEPNNAVINTEEQEGLFETSLPHIEPAIVMEGKVYYMLDLNRKIQGGIPWEYSLIKHEYQGQYMTCLTDNDKNIYFVYLINEQEDIRCYAYNASQKMFYPCSEYSTNDMIYWYVSPYAVVNRPEGLTEEIIENTHIIYAIDETGKGAFSYLGEDGSLVTWEKEADAQNQVNAKSNTPAIIAVVVVVIVVLAGAWFYLVVMKRKNA